MHSNRRRRPVKMSAAVTVFAMIVAAVMVVILMISFLKNREFAYEIVSSAPTQSLSPTVNESAAPTTTTTAATETAAKSTDASPTAAQKTTTASPTTTRGMNAIVSGGDYITDIYSGRDMLQYDTAGHYVQSKSYGGQAVPWRLLLVNDWNQLPDGYDKEIAFTSINGQRCDSRILTDLQNMLEAGKAYGIGVQSGYRAASLQSTLYWRKVDEYLKKGYDLRRAQEVAGTIVKRPGYSEHNCGLALDLGGSGNFNLEEDFAGTPAYQWLIAHCAEYGFILRFPKGKENITGVVYEPWHYRYVGKDVATEIMRNGWCLEEYLQAEKK